LKTVSEKIPENIPENIHKTFLANLKTTPTNAKKIIRNNILKKIPERF
jgi:hypothetical protein